MQLRLSNAPCSWGIEFADNPSNPKWNLVLDEIAQAGYKATELGPLNYFPTDVQQLKAELAQRDLQLIAGTIFKHLHDPSRRQEILDYTHATCKVLQPQNAKYMVVIDHVSSPRTDQAGQILTADRLPPEQWQGMMQTINELSRICQDEYGIIPVLHPHAGTYIEYRDEIDRAMNDLDESIVKLCIDSGHCTYAGINPSELIRTYAERVKYLHFKDINGKVLEQVVAKGTDFYTAIGQGVFCPLGQGSVDFQQLRQTLIDLAFDGWVTVEQDVDPAALNNSSLENARQSLSFIQDTVLRG
ncbi:sugar phosphate isomerase/epimerase family protein [Marinobacterium rhizophilum]|uniref:TIM barrel protein n=1 Tax=Marinobacterium rhizophilum TaxID=420402 RepID=A0ABY5HIV0_9GAMM|nr:sugar phosphate isomerase/epimerase [Marinobacterium rhizophilum]UTW11207.1 TIM barrel protein [Marinobacterium rhizophilum]